MPSAAHIPVFMNVNALAAPDAPTNVVGTISGTTATLTWAAPTNTGGSPITGYTASRDGNDSNGYGAYTNTVGATTYSQVFNNLIAGSTYYLSVAAINTVGTGIKITISITLPAAATVPSVPTNLAATVSGTTVTFSWSAPSAAGGSAITGYTVSRDGTDSNGSGAYTTSVSASTTSQVFNNLVAGNTYNLSVYATNSTGNSSTATLAYTVPAAASTAPGVPTSVTTSTSGTSVTISWAAPASNGGSAITGYTVSRDGTDSNGYGAYTANDSATTFSQVFNYLNAGSTYNFSVAAVNAIGTGTAVVKAVTLAASSSNTAPAAPSNVTATVSGTSATLTWSAPSSNGGSAITGYTVSRDGTDSGGSGAYSTTTGASTLTFTFNNLVAGSTYHLTVAAVNAIGTSTTVTVNASIASATSTTGTEVPVGISGSFTRTFTDEFNGTSIDRTKWGTTWYGGTDQNGYNKYASYLSLPGDGTVHLTTDASGNGAILTANPVNGDVSPGYQFGTGTVLEARVSFAGSGTSIYSWPAFWCDCQNWPSGGEIDVFEGLGYATSNYHSNSGSNNSGRIAGTWSNAFHTYAVYEASGTNYIYWDGTLVRSYTTDDGGALKYPMFTSGGSADSHYGSQYDMKVDYIRAWTKTA